MTSLWSLIGAASAAGLLGFLVGVNLSRQPEASVITRSRTIKEEKEARRRSLEYKKVELRGCLLYSGGSAYIEEVRREITRINNEIDSLQVNIINEVKCLCCDKITWVCEDTDEKSYVCPSCILPVVLEFHAKAQFNNLAAPVEQEVDKG